MNKTLRRYSAKKLGIIWNSLNWRAVVALFTTTVVSSNIEGSRENREHVVDFSERLIAKNEILFFPLTSTS